MGNLNSPTVNRWGVNVFWPKMWYSDTNFASNLQQDKIFTLLLNTYLRYGLYTFKDFFFDMYWYKNQTHAKPSMNHRSFVKYFRWRQYRQDELNINSVQRFRKETIDFFHLTTWILKFGGWVVINLYWFKPHRKKKNIIAIKKGKKVFADFFPHKRVTSYTNVKRFKLLFFNSFYRNLNLQCYYKF